LNDQLLSKLMDTLDEVRERVIRIDENQKDFKDIKVDVGNLKVSHAQVDASVKSAHKRIDDVEATVKKVLFWVSTTVIGTLIAGLVGYLVFSK